LDGLWESVIATGDDMGMQYVAYTMGLLYHSQNNLRDAEFWLRRAMEMPNHIDAQLQAVGGA